MAERRQRLAPGRQLGNMFMVLALWSLGLLAVLAAGLQRAATMEQLFLDPAYLTGSPWYTGLFTNVGILAWTVAATAAGGGAWVASRAGRPTVVPFLASAAFVTAILLADDMLQLHADLLPAIGLHKLAAKAVVVAPVPLWLFANRVELLRTRWVLLCAALAGFAGSLVAEFIASPAASGSTGSLVLEDSAKLLGVLAWAQYFVVTTVDITRSAIDDVVGRPPAGRQRKPADNVPARHS